MAADRVYTNVVYVVEQQYEDYKATAQAGTVRSPTVSLTSTFRISHLCPLRSRSLVLCVA